jgi:saccharopine dehydrogenase (NAD+, L-lysine-forming)
MIGAMMVVTGKWQKPGVYTTDEFDPDPYMEALNRWGLPWTVEEDPQVVE